MNGLPQIHDGPAPALTLRGPLAATRWYCPKKGSTTTQTQTTATTDSRVGISGDGNVTLKDVSGNVTLNTLADDVAITALDTAAGLGANALDTAAGLGANALDTAVALNQTSANTLTDLAGGALDGLNSLLDSNQRTTREAFSLVQASAANSAASSRQVADSQKEFLRAQTGQDTVVKIIGYGLATLAVGGLALAVATSPKSK